MRLCALILAPSPQAPSIGRAPLTAASPAAEKRLGHISIVSEGSGSPVVLIPGLSTPRAVWDGVAPELVRNHRVISSKINGFGGDDPGMNLAPGISTALVADLHAYLTAEEARPGEDCGPFARRPHRAPAREGAS